MDIICAYPFNQCNPCSGSKPHKKKCRFFKAALLKSLKQIYLLIHYQLLALVPFTILTLHLDNISAGS